MSYVLYLAERSWINFRTIEPVHIKTTLDTLTLCEGLAKGIKFTCTQIKVLLWTDLKIVKIYAEFLLKEIKYWSPGANLLELAELAKRLLPIIRGDPFEKKENGELKKTRIEITGLFGVFIFRTLGFVKHLGEHGLFSLSALATTIGSIPVVGGLMSYVTISRFGAVSLCFEVVAQYKAYQKGKVEQEALVEVLNCIHFMWDKHQKNALKYKHGLPIDWNGYDDQRLFLERLANNDQVLKKECEAFDKIRKNFHQNAAGFDVELDALLKRSSSWNNGGLHIQANNETRNYCVRKWMMLKNIEATNKQKPLIAMISAITKLFAIVVIGELFPFMDIALSKGWDLIVSESVVIPNFYKVWMGKYGEYAKSPEMTPVLKQHSSALFEYITTL